jgi:hypothetical protein
MTMRLVPPYFACIHVFNTKILHGVGQGGVFKAGQSCQRPGLRLFSSWVRFFLGTPKRTLKTGLQFFDRFGADADSQEPA